MVTSPSGLTMSIALYIPSLAGTCGKIAFVATTSADWAMLRVELIAPHRLRIAARQVVARAVALDGEREPDPHRRLAVAHRVEVDRVLEGVGAVGDAPELLAQQRLRVARQLGHLREMISSPYLSISACRRVSPVRQAAICANSHPGSVRHAGVAQDEAQHLVVELALADEVDGRDVERLAVRSTASAWKLPGTGPPASDQCAEFCENATSSPSRKTGMIVRTSWQCVPPRKASFMMMMSPSWRRLLADPRR